MTRRLLLPLAAGLALFGATAMIPAPASAQLSGAAAAIDLNAKSVSNVTEVGRRDRRHRRHWGPRHNWRWHARPRFYSPYAYYPRRCGYVWSYRYGRHIYRCW